MAIEISTVTLDERIRSLLDEAKQETEEIEKLNPYNDEEMEEALERLRKLKEKQQIAYWLIELKQRRSGIM